jgi:orotate phosphoribosyltransferase-like protein
MLSSPPHREISPYEFILIDAIRDQQRRGLSLAEIAAELDVPQEQVEGAITLWLLQ